MEVLFQQLTGNSSSKTLLFWMILIYILLIFAGCLHFLPNGMVGLIPFIMALGGLLHAFGERISLVRNFLGGGPIIVIFGSSLMVHYGLIPSDVSASITEFISNNGFLALFISSLIIGSLLGMERHLLLKSVLWYFPVILGGITGAILLVGLIGMIIGNGFTETIFYIGLPIMGGGMGAGVIPLAEIFANILNTDSAIVLSKMVPAVVLGNLVAIVAAGMLDKLSKIRPALSGEGSLMKNQKYLKVSEDKVKSIPNLLNMGSGLFIASSFFIVGHLLSLLIPLHPYALMIISVGIVKALGIMPTHFEEGASLWGEFMVLTLTPALLACIGICFTNFYQIVEVISLQYFILVVATVVGAIIGAGSIGIILGFYPIEASITAGLCMANMGGTGDIAVLSASRRINLMPFAQISSRIGGTFILLLATALFSLF